MRRWLFDWYCVRLRRLDCEILWPSCKEHAPDIVIAKRAFRRHTRRNFSWRLLTEAEVDRIIGGLE